MKDRQLEEKLRLLSLQLDSWKRLHDLLTYGLDKAKPIISAEQEKQFTSIRQDLLQETEYIYRQLGMAAEISTRTMNVLNRGASLRAVRELSGEEARRLETDWNAVFTKLGLIQGQMKARRKQLRDQTKFQYYTALLLRRQPAS